MKSTIKPGPGPAFSTRNVLRVLRVTGALLLIPFVAMLATKEMNWGPGDFAAAALLLAGTGLALELAVAKLRTRKARLAAAALIVLALLVAWAELAVGIFH